MSRKWTPEERAKESERIRARKPWEKSTGPKSSTGKKISSRNAITHGMDSEAARVLLKALTLTSKTLKALKSQ